MEYNIQSPTKFSAQIKDKLDELAGKSLEDEKNNIAASLFTQPLKEEKECECEEGEECDCDDEEECGDEHDKEKDDE